jgi:glutathione synthase/RimK-type ligase-like ATP-grasp enzyme
VALIKSPWDYFDRIEEFNAWLKKIESLNVRLLNPVDIVRWNSDKHYLQDISDAGLPVTPTRFIEKGATPDLMSWFRVFRTDRLIIKPSISGGSKNTFQFSEADVPELEPTIKELLKSEGFMVQPFLKEIQDEGEWSFLFFNGTFSHCLLKKAKAGDFRVQHYLGGTIHPQTPEPQLLQSAERYVRQFAKGCLHARVDGVITGGEFHLMELELIEPFLFLFTDENSYENYYTGLIRLLSNETVRNEQ